MSRRDGFCPGLVSKDQADITLALAGMPYSSRTRNCTTGCPITVADCAVRQRVLRRRGRSDYGSVTNSSGSVRRGRSDISRRQRRPDACLHDVNYTRMDVFLHCSKLLGGAKSRTYAQRFRLVEVLSMPMEAFAHLRVRRDRLFRCLSSPKSRRCRCDVCGQQYRTSPLRPAAASFIHLR